MKKTVLAVLAILALSLALVAAASASGHKQWFHHTKGNGKVVCNQSDATPNAADAGPFSTKADCLAYGNGGNENPPPTPTGWPSSHGTISGNATGNCGDPVVLTSDENAPGYGAFDFSDVAGIEFDNLGLDFDFTVLSGTQAQSEPYFIVRFNDGTQAFVYSVDVNPGEAGDQVFSLTGNTYITRDEAMEQWGTKIVSSVTLAVDNGNLSIETHGLSVDGACVTPPADTPDSDYLCYSTFQTVPGSWQLPQAADLIAGGYWEAEAVAGNVDGGINVGAYHLVCNSGLTPTGESVGDGGSVYGADYGPAIEELGFYAIVA